MLGNHVQAKANAAVVKSAEAQMLTKGTASLALTGGEDIALGVDVGTFHIDPAEQLANGKCANRTDGRVVKEGLRKPRLCLKAPIIVLEQDQAVHAPYWRHAAKATRQILCAQAKENLLRNKTPASESDSRDFRLQRSLQKHEHVDPQQ